MEDPPPPRPRRNIPRAVIPPPRSLARSVSTDAGETLNRDGIEKGSVEQEGTETETIEQDGSDTAWSPPREQARVNPDCSMRTVNVRALSGLKQVRTGIAAIIQKKRYSLKEALHTESLALRKRHHRVFEENDRAKYVTRKCVEKTSEHNKAFGEYERACEVLRTALTDFPTIKSAGEPTQKPYIRNFESLVNSWAKNVQVTEENLSSWEFKSKSQATMVARVSKEFRAAETAANESRKKIHEDLEELKALEGLLRDL